MFNVIFNTFVLFHGAQFIFGGGSRGDRSEPTIFSRKANNSSPLRLESSLPATCVIWTYNLSIDRLVIQ